MPGWLEGTVGYHVDDERIFHGNPYKGIEVEGNINFHELSFQLISN